MKPFEENYARYRELFKKDLKELLTKLKADPVGDYDKKIETLMEAAMITAFEYGMIVENNK